MVDMLVETIVEDCCDMLLWSLE